MDEQKFSDIVKQMADMIDSLVEENEALRQMGDTLTFSSRNPLPTINPDRLAAHLIKRCGPERKIEQIKELRAITNWGLKQSKDFVEEFCFTKDKNGNPTVPREIVFGPDLMGIPHEHAMPIDPPEFQMPRMNSVDFVKPSDAIEMPDDQWDKNWKNYTEWLNQNNVGPDMDR